MRTAEEFWRVAQEVMVLADDERDVANAAATLLIHAGIASSDVICCARLGVFAQGEDHRQAIGLVSSADPAGHSGTHLSTLLGLKTKAGYSHVRVSATELKQASRAAEQLVSIARQLTAT